MDEYTQNTEKNPVMTQESFTRRYNRLINWATGIGVVVASGIGIYVLAVDQNGSEDQPILDNPVAACAFNMIDSQATLEDTELAVSRCDTQGNLIELQVTVMAHQVLEAAREQS